MLGSQFILVRGDTRVAMWLWCLGIVLWLVLTYAVFTSLTVKDEKPALPDGLNGGWLLSVVATQSVAVLGNLLVPSIAGAGREEVVFFCLAMWLGGGMLYVWIISLIFYRYTFFPLTAANLAAPYWINMGAMAISTLAGAGLVANGPHSPLLERVAPLHQGRHAPVLGDGDLVDPDAAAPGGLAPHRPEVPPGLRPVLLGGGLPPGDVYGLHLPPGRGPGPALPPGDPPGRRLHRPGRLAPDGDRPRSPGGTPPDGP